MIRLFLVALAAPLFLEAQVDTPVLSVGTGPGSFIGMGVSYDASASPKLVGHVWYASLVNKKAKVYSWTAVDLLYTKHANMSTAVESGVAPWVRDIGKAHLYALGAAGAAVTSLTTTSNPSSPTVGGASTAGGLLVYPIKGGFSVGINIRMIKLTGATSQPAQASVGIDIIYGK